MLFSKNNPHQISCEASYGQCDLRPCLSYDTKVTYLMNNWVLYNELLVFDPNLYRFTINVIKVVF